MKASGFFAALSQDSTWVRSRDAGLAERFQQFQRFSTGYAEGVTDALLF